MREHQNIPEDDESVEISDLEDEEDSSSNGRRKSRSERAFVSLLRWSRRHRHLSVLATILLVSLTLLLLIGNMLPVPTHSPGNTEVPPVFPTPMTGPDLFYFRPLPAWGTVLLDGQPLAHVPLPRGRFEPPVRIPPGQHLLEWRADPFEPQRCVLLVPPRSGAGQTCQVTVAPATMFADHASLITFPVSLAQLPLTERAALIQASQSLLDTLRATEVIRPGEHYALDADARRIQVAQTALRATLRLVLDTDPHAGATCAGVSLGQGCTVEGRDCHLFCTPFWPPTPGEGWDIAALFHPVWQYQSIDGQPLADGAGIQQRVAFPQQFVALHVSRHDNRWHVTFQDQKVSSFADPVCIGTVGLVGASPFYQFLPGGTLSLRWAYASSSENAAAGCLAATPIQQGPVSTQSPKALLLQRFGVLLAANDVAHRLWPALPLADKNEQQLAWKLLQATSW